jgi:hypothetical protein
VLRRIFGRKRDTIIGGFRKLHNEELCNMYSPPIVFKIINPRRIGWAGRGKRNACKIFLGKPEGRQPLGGRRCRWEDNIKMVLGEVGWGDMYRIHLAQDSYQWRALVNTVISLWVP